MPPTFEDYQATIARIYQTYPDGTSTGAVVGTGFLLSSQYLLTCAHVVMAALGLEGTTVQANVAPTTPICLDFPRQSANITPNRAMVVLWQPCPDFDLFQQGQDWAFLKLESAIADIMAIPLHHTEDSLHNHRCSIYGFPYTNPTTGETSIGNFTSPSIQMPGCWEFIVDAEQPAIVQGFSGSPIWGQTEEAIIGMTVAEGISSSRQKAYAIASFGLYDVWQKQGRLIELLDAVKWTVIQRAYQHCLDQKEPWGSDKPTNLPEVVVDLYKMDEDHEHKEQLCNFAVYLLVDDSLPETQKLLLKQWIQDVLNWRDTQIAQQCDRLKAILKSDSTTTVQSCLWLILEEPGPAGQYHLKPAYFIPNLSRYNPQHSDTYRKIELTTDTYIERKNLEQELPERLTEIYQQIPPLQHLHIEVFLPYKSLDLAPDIWQVEADYEEQGIGQLHPLVIRVLDRLGYTKPYKYGPKWSNQWPPQQLQQTVGEGLVCCTLGRDRLLKALETGESCGFRSPSPLHTQGSKPLPLLMREGIAIALWIRCQFADCEANDRYQDLLNSPLAQLPTQLRWLRNADIENAQHMGRHLSLLWDDPTKRPPDAPEPYQLIQ